MNANLRDLVLGPTVRNPNADPFFSAYGLGRNPFPPNRTILPEVLYNQQHAIDRVAEAFRGVLSEAPQRRAMAVLAGTGGGKTHFLRHCRWMLESALKETPHRLVFVDFQAGSGKLQDLAREIVSAGDAFCRESGEEDFVTGLITRLRSSSDNSQLQQVHQDELRSALTRLLEASEVGFRPKDKAGQYDFGLLREVCRRWLVGATLSQTERRYLGVISRINTASMAVRVLTEAFRLARSLGLFHGVVLCLDEIETLFLGSQRAAQYQAFLQDLRFLYDEAEKSGSGYSLFLLSASTPYGARLLQQVNYPIFQRLGFDAAQRVQLLPISGVEDAKSFASTYVEFERTRFLRGQQDSQTIPELLDRAEIEEAYQAARGAADSAKGDVTVNQAPLLDALHKKAEEKHSRA